MSATPLLDQWLARLIGQGSVPLPEALRDWQLKKLRETVRYAAERSPHYRELYTTLPSEIRSSILKGEFPHSFAEMACLPFSSSEDIEQDWKRFLCVSQDAVARMVTLRTSGTMTGAGGKRLAFTEEELGRTADFFAVGMSVLLCPGDRVLVLLPGADRPCGVADLLIRSLPFLGKGISLDPEIPLETRLTPEKQQYSSRAEGFAVNPGAQEEEFIAELKRVRPQALVAAPSQLSRLLDAPSVTAVVRAVGLRSLLASSEVLPHSLRCRLEHEWGCQVFDHYGMTESAYGGAVECPFHDGMHIREADIFLECVDAVSGELLPPGQEGEIVLTTLTRQAMPLIRYRTGDYAALLPGPCRCGSPLRRLGSVCGRIVRKADGVSIIRPKKGGSRADSVANSD